MKKRLHPQIETLQVKCYKLNGELIVSVALDAVTNQRKKSEQQKLVEEEPTPAPKAMKWYMKAMVIYGDRQVQMKNRSYESKES